MVSSGDSGFFSIAHGLRIDLVASTTQEEIMSVFQFRNQLSLALIVVALAVAVLGGLTLGAESAYGDDNEGRKCYVVGDTSENRGDQKTLHLFGKWGLL